jgi:hypothetical protein
MEIIASGMLHLVIWQIGTNVSEESAAFFFKVQQVS